MTIVAGVLVTRDDKGAVTVTPSGRAAGDSTTALGLLAYATLALTVPGMVRQLTTPATNGKKPKKEKARA